MRRVALLIVPAVTVFGAIAGSRPVTSQSGPGDGLVLQGQTYAVVAESTARFELLVTADVPEIATTTTTTSTTTTTTTTTSTTTTTLPAGSPPTETSEPPDQAVAAPPTATTQPTPTTTVDPGPEMTVQIRAHRALTSRAAVDRSLDDSAGPVIDILEFELAAVSRFDEASGQRLLELDVPITSAGADEEQLDLPGPGVYPVTIQVRRDNSLVTAHTTFVEVVELTGIGRGPFRFSVLAALSDPGPDPSAAQLAALTAGLGEIADLATASGAPLAVALPPGVTSGVLAAEPQLASRLADALDPNDGLIALPDRPLDPSAAAEAGLNDEFERLLGEGESRLSAAFEIQPIARSAWPTDDRLTSEGAALLRDSGIPMLVVPFDRYLGFEGSLGDLTDTSLLLSARLPDDTAIRMLVVDPIMELLEPERDTGNSPIEDAVRLMATTGAMRYQLDPDLRSMALTTADLTAPDPAVLAHLEQFVAEHPDYSFQPLDRIADITNRFFVEGSQVTVDLDALASVSIAGRSQRIDATRLRIADVASMLPDSDPRPTDWDAALRTALSTGLDDPQANLLIGDVESDLERIRSAVQQPEKFSFTITGRDADIPVRVENTGDTPLRVMLRFEAEKLSFPSDEVEAVLLPNAITPIPVPVSARTNGIFPVQVEVVTPAGNRLGEPVELTARVSTLAGLGRVFTVGALLVLASWWFSYFRRRRKADRKSLQASTRARHPAQLESALAGSGELSSTTSPDAAAAMHHPNSPTTLGDGPAHATGPAETDTPVDHTCGDDTPDDSDADPQGESEPRGE